MPADLIERCFGRLRSLEKTGSIGLVAAYLDQKGTWHPDGRACVPSEVWNPKALEAIYTYYCVNFSSFVDTPGMRS